MNNVKETQAMQIKDEYFIGQRRLLQYRIEKAKVYNPTANFNSSAENMVSVKN